MAKLEFRATFSLISNGEKDCVWRGQKFVVFYIVGRKKSWNRAIVTRGSIHCIMNCTSEKYDTNYFYLISCYKSKTHKKINEGRYDQKRANQQRHSHYLICSNTNLLAEVSPSQFMFASACWYLISCVFLELPSVSIFWSKTSSSWVRPLDCSDCRPWERGSSTRSRRHNQPLKSN